MEQGSSLAANVPDLKESTWRKSEDGFRKGDLQGAQWDPCEEAACILLAANLVGSLPVFESEEQVKEKWISPE